MPRPPRPTDPAFAAVYGEAWSSDDPSRLLEFFAEPLTYQDLGTGLEAHDRASLARFVAAMVRFAPDSRIAFDEPMGDARRFALRWVWSGTATGPLRLDGRTYPPAGRPFAVEGVALCVAGEDGRLLEHRDLYDMHAVLRDLGLREVGPTGPGAAELARRAYPALAAGDREGLAALLDPAFTARFSDGMPVGGGVAQGPERALEHWWAIGREFAVRAHPEDVVELPDGRALVLGRYRGRARSTGAPIDAAFAHVWTARAGRLAQLQQITDTARWYARAGSSPPGEA